MIHTDNGDGTITFALTKPVKHGEKTYETLTLKTEATAGDIEVMDDANGTQRSTQRLIVQLSVLSLEKPGVKLPIVRKLGAFDYMAISKVVGRIIHGLDPMIEPKDGDDEEDEDAEDDGGGKEA